jgi:hypothetical protein
MPHRTFDLPIFLFSKLIAYSCAAAQRIVCRQKIGEQKACHNHGVTCEYGWDRIWDNGKTNSG